MLQHKTDLQRGVGFYCNVEFELYKVVAQLVFLVQLIAHLLYSTIKTPHKEGRGFGESCTELRECAMTLAVWLAVVDGLSGRGIICQNDFSDSFLS